MTNDKALLVEHAVSNFETWKAAFDAHEGKRKEHSFTAHHLNRGVDDTNIVTVFMLYGDQEKVESFIDSDDLKAAMADAGVKSKPDFTFCTPTLDRVIWDRELPAVIVRHQVADYDAWKKVYDKLDDVRAQAGIIGDAVNRSGDDGNLVIVYHQAETRKDLEAFMNSSTLKAAMAEAGVISAPQISFVTGGVN